MNKEVVVINKIKASDNNHLSELIKSVFREFNLDIPGTVFSDPTTDNLFDLFRSTRSVYYVASINEQIVGGCGIFPTIGLPSDCAELVKLYVSPNSRGKNVGFKLLTTSISEAQQLGYKSLYLESFPGFKKAIELYKRSGFEALSAPLGNSGHFACNVWMLKKL